MASYSTRLIPPPQEEEIHPYRRVWPSIALEMGVLFGVTLVCYTAFRVLGLELPPLIVQALNAVLALLPLLLWVVFSLLRERAVLLPRQRLLTVMIVTGLAANAVGLPLVEGVFQIDRWLPLAPSTTRIVGYVITVGALQELLKYLVVRYTVWPDFFRTRLDGVAYTFASSIGYATLLNIQFVLTTATLPDSAAFFVFNTLALHVAASIIVGYGLAELKFAAPTPLLLLLTLVLASFVNGGLAPIRDGLVNAGFSINGAFPSPLIGFFISLAILTAVALTFAFLFERADRAAREAAGGASPS
ncbi:MAG: PrsW family glutamic-type intramembrane protease [bacterium]|nr:PrsW family glutamic-type intramembrane protease [bacterium]